MNTPRSVNCTFSTVNSGIWWLIHSRVIPISYKQNVGSICTLRNYCVDYEQAVNLTITEALLATLSVPPYFASLSIIKDAVTFEYTSADWKFRNPTQEIITEAYAAFGADERVACLLSLGCGSPGILTAPKNPNSSEWNQFLERLVEDGEHKSQVLESQIGPSSLYHRFSVTSGLESSTALGPGDIVTHTIVYLANIAVSRRIGICVDNLRLRDGLSSLDRLSTL